MSGNNIDPKFGQVVALPFAVANATAGAAAVDLVLAGGTGTLAVMPFAGSVVGIGVRASTAINTGDVSFQAHKDGTEWPDQSALAVKIAATTDTTSEADLETQGSVRPGVMRFEAGDGIGVSYSSSTTLDPTNTNDFDVILYVLLDS